MNMKLTNTALLKNRAYIGGQWFEADSGRSFSVINPANGETVCEVPDLREDETVKAVEAAEKALPEWKFLTGKARSEYLQKWYSLIIENADDLAALMTAEQGKPLKEAKGEVLHGADSVLWAAEEAKRIYGDFIPAHKSDARIIVSREPVGIVGAITPWNFPSAMITRKVPPALAAGCTVVLKPAEDTPLSALALGVLAEQAGIPPGVFNIVTTSESSTVGKILTDDDRVRKISFTGSTQVGSKLMEQSAPTIKKISLELGGNAPFIVFESADLEKAVKGAVASKFRNAGQTCISANRIYVQDSVFDSFVNKMLEQTRALNVGPGDQEDVNLGPLINQKGFDKVCDLMNDATEKGAKILTGGNPHELGGLFYEPTILTDVDKEMRLNCEEIFGPVAAIYPFKEENEVVKEANNTEYGLASYIYTNDQAQIWRVSEALEYGMVGINEPLLATELAPFGGVKHSGLGREGSKYSIEEFTEIKYRLWGGI